MKAFIVGSLTLMLSLVAISDATKDSHVSLKKPEEKKAPNAALDLSPPKFDNGVDKALTFISGLAATGAAFGVVHVTGRKDIQILNGELRIEDHKSSRDFVHDVWNKK